MSRQSELIANVRAETRRETRREIAAEIDKAKVDGFQSGRNNPLGSNWSYYWHPERNWDPLRETLRLAFVRGFDEGQDALRRDLATYLRETNGAQS